MLSLLTVLCLATAPAQAQNLFATGQTQDLFVANQSTNTIREFSPTGVDLGYFATTGLNGPTGLAFDKRNLYVSNINGNTIREFSPTGVDLGDFATTGLSSPRGIAFDKHGNLYVANSSWIRQLSPTGVDLGNFATSGLNIARGIAFDKHGNLYVANAGDNTIRKFSRTREDLGYFATTGFIAPALIAFDKKGNLYVTNFGGNTIREFSSTGVDLGDFAATGLSTPAGLAFDKDGNLYVSNRGDGTIRKFSRSGVDLGYFATTGMITPVGLAFGPKAGTRTETILDLPQPDSLERPVQHHVEPPVLPEEEQEAERDQRHAADDPDHDVVVAHPAERAHRACERDPGEEKSDADPERVREEQHRATEHRARTACEHEHRRQDRADARRRADREGGPEQRARLTPACVAEKTGPDDALRPRAADP